MNDISRLIDAMTDYYAGDPRRTAHFLKVYAYAKSIGELEGVDSDTQFLIETAAVVHDIGIKVSEAKYNSSAGPYQELEGPPLARDLLERLGFESAVIERACYLVGHHHTYSAIDGQDFRILVEADLIVNFQEEEVSEQSAMTACQKYFESKSAIRFLKRLYS